MAFTKKELESVVRQILEGKGYRVCSWPADVHRGAEEDLALHFRDTKTIGPTESITENRENAVFLSPTDYIVYDEVTGKNKYPDDPYGVEASFGGVEQFLGEIRLPEPHSFTLGEVTPDEEQLQKQPPKPAEYLAYLFLPRTDRETLLGDLTEEYPSVLAKFGRRGAQCYFYKQVVSSIWPLVRKAVVKWGLFAWVVELIRRISS